jgi:nucleotide-binding universal stress UspA family protein
MPTRLLIAYDGSPPAAEALATAGHLFSGAHGRVLTIFDLPLEHDQLQRSRLGAGTATLDTVARESLDAAETIAAQGVAIGQSVGLRLEPRATAEDPSRWRTIVAMADEIDADVIVCGSRGRGGVARSLLGSTSTSVLHHAERPVLVVPAGPAAIDGPALIAYDASPAARAAIAAAGRLLTGRRAVIVNVWYSSIRHTLTGRALAGGPIADLRELAGDYEQVFADAAASVVEEGVSLAREAGLDASGEPIESDSGAWRVLERAATDHGAAVIVCGSRGRGAAASTVLGSVSSGLVHNVETPTLVVPAGALP